MFLPHKATDALSGAFSQTSPPGQQTYSKCWLNDAARLVLILMREYIDYTPKELWCSWTKQVLSHRGGAIRLDKEEFIDLEIGFNTFFFKARRRYKFAARISSRTREKSPRMSDIEIPELLWQMVEGGNKSPGIWVCWNSYVMWGHKTQKGTVFLEKG